MERRKGRGVGDLELFDPNISLLSRVVKVERRVTLIDRKLDMLIEMYREERHAKTATEGGKEEEEQSQESDPAPRGFMRRRGWGSYHQKHRESPAQRLESSDTSSATSPADPTATSPALQKLPISTSQPTLVEDKPSPGMQPSHSQSDVNQSDSASLQSHDRMSDSTLRAEGSPHASDHDMDSDVCNPATSDQDIPTTAMPSSPDTVSYGSSRLSSTGSSSALDSETRI